MLAALTKTPELQLVEPQAKALGTAIANVARHYDTAIDQKSLDWFNLFQTAALIYTPVFIGVASRAKQRRPRQNAAQAEPGPQMNGQGFAGDFVDGGPAVVNMSTFQ